MKRDATQDGDTGRQVSPAHAHAHAAIDALCDGGSFDAAVTRQTLRIAASLNARRASLGGEDFRELLAIVVHTPGRGASALGLGPEEVEALIAP